MPTQTENGSRIFASHYQLVVCDDPFAFTEESNWTEADTEQGFAGNDHFRMVGTEADLNDHWVEVTVLEQAPRLESWDRVTCVKLRCDSSKIHVMSVIDEGPVITVDVPVGDYCIYVAGNNMGIDQMSLNEDIELEDHELAQRKDLEWYRIFVVPGVPSRVGRLVDSVREDAT